MWVAGGLNQFAAADSGSPPDRKEMPQSVFEQKDRVPHSRNKVIGEKCIK
jgi:hypothetical protein